MESAHHGADGNAELACGFAIRELVEVDELEDGAEALGKRIELALRRRRERRSRVRRDEAFGQRPGARTAAVIW